MLLKPRALALRAPHPVVVHNHGAVGAGRADAAHKVRRAVRVEIAREEAVGEAWCAPERVVERRLLACSQTWLHSSVWAEWAWRARSVCTTLTRSFSRRARSRSRLRFLTTSRLHAYWSVARLSGRRPASRTDQTSTREVPPIGRRGGASRSRRTPQRSCELVCGLVRA